MNIIKRLFPKYESKMEMKERLEMEISFHRNSRPGIVMRAERDINKVHAAAEFVEGTPTEIVERSICRSIASVIAPYVEYEETASGCGKRVTGSLYVAIRRGTEL